MVQVSNALFGSFMSYGCHLWHQKCHCYWSHCNHTYICYDIMPYSALQQLFTSHNGSSQQCSFGSFMCYWCHCYWNHCNHTRFLPHHALQLIASIVHLSFWIYRTWILKIYVYLYNAFDTRVTNHQPIDFYGKKEISKWTNSEALKVRCADKSSPCWKISWSPPRC